jgi:hypothetical protein
MEPTDTLSMGMIKETNKYLDYFTKLPISQISVEYYLKKDSENELIKVEGDDFSVKWIQWYTLIKDKQNRILKIQYNCEAADNISYGRDYYFNEKGKLILIICNSAWVSSDYSKAFQEEILYYFNQNMKTIKKTYDLFNQKKEKLDKQENIFTHKSFPVYWTDNDFLNYYKINN